MTGEPRTHQWRLVDPWWESYADLGVVRSQAVDGIDGQLIEEWWAELGACWEAYNEARSDDVSDLYQILAESDALWEQRHGPFDADPLSADIDQTGHPFNLDREEAWSDWLAQLLRADSGEFHYEMFDRKCDDSRRQVKREAHLQNPGGKDRYADILSLCDSEQISIEVKIGDTNLEKTTDTTALIEDQHYGEWQHYLLLPEQDTWAVRESFDVEVADTDGERDAIPSDGSDEVAILYWSDVSRALRTVLLDENTQSPHWSASAYLFCSRIEQNSLGLTSRPVIDRIGAEEGTVQLFQSISVVIGDIEAQQEYLTAFIEDNNE